MSKSSWEDINGKTIYYRTKGKIIESLVIANPEIGISIKPSEPKDVPEGNWRIPPSDPDFYFVCTRATMKSAPDNFEHWVEILSQNKKLFTRTDISAGASNSGTCPFSSH